MADLQTLITNTSRDGYFGRIAGNALAQFGSNGRNYLGATLLPERTVEDNAYREENIRYRTVIANDGTRYSPVQKKSGELVASFLVELGNSDIGREMTGRDYDAIIRLLGRGSDQEAAANLIGFADQLLNRALLEHNERQRWQAIVNAQVTRAGDNSYTETVTYTNPTGHRFNASSAWGTAGNDPFVDILAAKSLLASKGFRVNRIITSEAVQSILVANDKTRNAVLNRSDGAGLIPVADLDGYFTRNALPAIETYDLQYRTQTGSGRFLASNVMVFVATTGQDETIDAGDNGRIVNETLGYTAIGRATGQPAPGRVIRMFPKDDKPPRIEGEAWQTSLPVITEPEAIVVIGGIS